MGDEDRGARQLVARRFLCRVHFVTARFVFLRPCGRRDEQGKEQCGGCGGARWSWDPRWPELVHPFASAIDTDLPVAPERTHLMLASRAPWVEPTIGPDGKTFDEYPAESIAAWHGRLGLVVD